MKKTTFLAICFILLSSYPHLSFAAPAFGIKGGLNIGGISYDPSSSTQRRALFMLGGTLEIAIAKSNNTTIRGEMLLVGKGWKETVQYVNEFQQPVAKAERRYTTSELVMAPFVVFKFPSRNMIPFVEFGPELGLNLANSIKSPYESGSLQDWSGTNYGLNFGAGLAFPSGKGQLIADIRYNLGLANMYSGAGTFSEKTNGIQLLFGYNFSVAKQ